METHPFMSLYSAVSTTNVGRIWNIANSKARNTSLCISDSSRIAGNAAQYVPINGMAPRMAANAESRCLYAAIKIYLVQLVHSKAIPQPSKYTLWGNAVIGVIGSIKAHL